MKGALIVIAFLLGISGVAAAEEKVWSRTALLAIADQQVKRLGYDVDRMSLSFDAFNSQWRHHLKSLERVGGEPEVEKKLQGKHFWALHYAPLGEGLGGDLWVFVDRETGNVIHVIQGE